MTRPTVDRRRPVTRKTSRRGRSLAARCELLESRLVMSTSTALDPSFGTGGVVFGSASPSDTNLSSATAVAVQSDGKIVEVGSVGTGTSIQNPGLAARRYNADGSVDTTFGTNGQVTIPYAAYSGQFSDPPKNVVIESNGDIVFAAIARPALIGMSANFATYNSVVVRLAPTGQLDSTFGTDGEYVFPQDGPTVTNVAVQADGKVVAAGLTYNVSAPYFAVTRLTTAGALDTTYNGTGSATAPLQVAGQSSTPPVSGTFVALTLTPAGQVLVGGSISYLELLNHTGFIDTTLSEFSTGGTLNSSFGTAGQVSLTTAQAGLLDALAVQADGSIVVAGTTNYDTGTARLGSTGLIRLTAAGVIDTTFAGVVPTQPTGTVPAGYNANSIAVDASGRIILGGTASIGTSVIPFVARYLATGAVDPSFGLGGRSLLNFVPTFSDGNPTTPAFALNNVTVTATGNVLAAGSITNYYRDPTTGQSGANQGNQAFLAQVLPVKTIPVANDYDGDGKADIAGVLGAFGLYAFRPSSGAADVLAPFGPSTVGAAIPAPGDYDGDGKADIAAYFPAYGSLVYRPSSGGADVVVPIGIAGAGNSIPDPGDYDGDGKTDPAVYLPALGILAYRPSSGGQDVIIPFGSAGAGNSIPAPGDYDGDGKTDPAVYLPAFGILAYRPSSGGADVLTQFGIAGAGNSNPAPGDYDGDGKTDLAVYLPTLGIYAYRPSSGGADVLEQFGIPGAQQSIPAPGDYDGDGRTDLAVYLPSIGYMAERPSSGGADVLSQFGAAGVGQTVPAASLSAAFGSSAASGTVSASSVAVHDLALTDDLVSAELAMTRRKRKTTS